VLSAAKAVEDKLDEEIAALERLDPDDIEALRERRNQQMRRAAERRAKWRAQGHGEYAEVPEKEFFAAAKASERLVCHFYRDNWPCKVRDLLSRYCALALAWLVPDADLVVNCVLLGTVCVLRCAVIWVDHDQIIPYQS
jgi:hypothetical protein